MAIISRQLPRTVDSRNQALQNAVQKRTSLPPADDTLRTATNTTLTALQTSYVAGITSRNNGKAAVSNNTIIKNDAGTNVRMFISHFLQVFNLAVDRGTFPQGDRAYYNMDVDSPTLPDTATDQAVVTVYNYILVGETQRTAAGGAPMANPSMAEVTTAFGPFQTALVTQSNLKDALDIAEEALDDLNVQADELIRKIWDEVESKYADEPKESQRQNAREWGVTYVSRGNTPTAITVLVRAVNVPQQGAFVRLIASDLEGVTDSNGVVIFSTNLVGEETVRAFLTGKPPLDVNITIVEGVPQEVVVDF
ncbi:MAG: hypothetical protein ACKVOR_05360 [Flavobacteriales bacterium]